MDSFDFEKPRQVTRGPLSFFNDSFIVEFLEHVPSEASTLIRATYKADNKLNRTGRNHPQAPPLHIHFDQTETFKVLQGQMAVAIGYDQREVVLRPDNTPFDVPPMLPHSPYPHMDASKISEDTVVIVRAHPGGVGEPLDDAFFEDLFKHLDECWNDGNKMPNLVKLLTAQHKTSSAMVVLPNMTNLGSLRWRIPYVLQSVVATVGAFFGY